MHIVAQHRITDPEKFFSQDAQQVVENAPDGVQGRQFFPSEDRTTAVCLWEADSVDAVREYVDDVTEGASENTFFAVDSQYAMGLPEGAGASA